MGYRYPAPVIPYAGEAGTPFEGLRIEVRKVRTGAEFRALTQNTLLRDQLAVAAPYIVGWNLEAVEEVREDIPVEGDGEPGVRVRLATVPAPVPAEAGPEILEGIDRPVLEWILAKVIGSAFHRDDDPKAPPPPSSDTPNGAPDETSPGETRSDSGPSRRPARRSSRGRSAST